MFKAWDQKRGLGWCTAIVTDFSISEKSVKSGKYFYSEAIVPTESDYQSSCRALPNTPRSLEELKKMSHQIISPFGHPVVDERGNLVSYSH